MSRFKKLIGAALLASTFAVAGAAHAANITVFTDQAQWQAAVSGAVTVEDFTDATLVAGFGVSSGTVGTGVYNGQGLPGVFPNPNSFSFTGGVTAFGGDWDLRPGGNGGGLFFTALFASGSQAAGSILNTNTAQFNGFWGFVSDTALTGLQFVGGNFTGNSETFTLDNARLAFVGGNGGNGGGSVPEPGTLTLLATALLLFGRRLRAQR